VRETRTLRVMWRELETGLRKSALAAAPVPGPTGIVDPAFLTVGHLVCSGARLAIHSRLHIEDRGRRLRISSLD
jgi:hypothetical protein